MCARSLPLSRQIVSPTWHGATPSMGRTSCSATDVAWDLMPGGRFQKTACGRVVQVIPADRATHAQRRRANTRNSHWILPSMNSCVKSQLCLCHCVAIHSTARLSFARHLRRLKAPQPVPPELSSVMVIEQDGCTKTVAETAAPVARRSAGKVSDKSPVRIMDGTTTEKIAEWNLRKMEASAS